MQNRINGILLLDKPPHITSNAALQRVKHLFNAEKAGHTGSLDPIATGMLPICFGQATKFSQFLLESNKSYRVEAKLGIQTTTSDCEGEVIATKPVIGITSLRIEQILATFNGELEQIPPMYSAIKYQGQPLYALARRGIEVERKARRITIFAMTLEHFDTDQFIFSVHCSKGTYIRTLVEDIGRELGCGAHVQALRRLTVDPYKNAAMYTLPTLLSVAEHAGKAGLAACLLSVESAVAVLPAVKLSNAAIFYLRMGQSVKTSLDIASTYIRLLSEDTRFIGIGEVLPDGRIKPLRLL